MRKGGADILTESHLLNRGSRELTQIYGHPNRMLGHVQMDTFTGTSVLRPLKGEPTSGFSNVTTLTPNVKHNFLGADRTCGVYARILTIARGSPVRPLMSSKYSTMRQCNM